MFRDATKHDKVACSGVENDCICYDDRVRITIDLDK